MGTINIWLKPPFLHAGGGRGFVFCGPSGCTSQRRMALRLWAKARTEPDARTTLIVSGSSGLEGSPLCPGPNLLAKSRPHFKWLLRFVIGFGSVEPLPGQAMEDQEELFREDRGWPNEKLHPLPVPLKTSCSSTLSPIACHTSRPQNSVPPYNAPEVHTSPLHNENCWRLEKQLACITAVG